MSPAADLPRVDADGAAARLWVRAQPGARRSGVGGLWRDHLQVAVGAPAVDGRANEAVLEQLAALFGVRAGALAVVQGATSRNKVVLVPLDRERVLAVVAAHLAAR